MKNILLVDDNPLMLKFVDDLLEKEDYKVVTANDGLSALDILKTYTPDVIFVDLIMPNINGKKLIKIIRNIPKLKDVVLLPISWRKPGKFSV